MKNILFLLAILLSNQLYSQGDGAKGIVIRNSVKDKTVYIPEGSKVRLHYFGVKIQDELKYGDQNFMLLESGRRSKKSSSPLLSAGDNEYIPPPSIPVSVIIISP